MKLAFLDSSGWDYDVDTPYQRPLGGSQSAMCYLAEALAARGHEVWLLNGREETTAARGVLTGSLQRQAGELGGFDAVIALNGIHTATAVQLRELAGAKPFMAFWTQHAHDQPAVGNLRDPAFRAVWDAYVLISDWQAERFAETFGLPLDRTRILRNAVSPAFAGRTPQPLAPTPVLAYTSTPFRGLDLLLEAFPKIRAAVPGTTLKVFSSMGVYRVAPENDQYAALYAACRAIPGVEYIGSVPQPQLAEEMARVDALAYPNTFPETSCISVLEALAAGCAVVTSELGALPETAAGWGQLLPVPPDRDGFVAAFAALMVETLQSARRHPAAAEARRRQQMARLNAVATWTVRAREWEEWLSMALAAHADGKSAGSFSASEHAPSAFAAKAAAGAPGAVALTPTAHVVSGRHGLFLTTGVDRLEARSLRLYGEWLEPVARTCAMLVRPGEHVVEIGAGIGGLTVPTAKKAGPGGSVTSFVADVEDFRLLNANLALNGLSQVDAAQGLPAGLGPLAARLPACRLLRVGPGVAAYEALDRAQALIDRHRPLIVAPTPDAVGYAQVYAWAKRLGYRLYWVTAYAYDGDNFFGRRENALGVAGFLGVLAAPLESPLQVFGQEETGAFDQAAALAPGLMPIA